MQYQISLLVFLFLSFKCIASEKEIPVSTTISEVTVYQQNALVKRKCLAIVPPGNSAIILNNLNSSIRPQDVKINSKGDFTILSITYRYSTDILSGQNGQKERDLITKEIQLLQQRITRENGVLSIYNTEEQMLMANQNYRRNRNRCGINLWRESQRSHRENSMGIKLV